MASEEAATIKKENTEMQSRKRTRDEAAMELEVAEIDAQREELQRTRKDKDVELNERELLFTRTLQEKDLEIAQKNVEVAQKELCLKLAQEGDERAISVILKRMRRC
jgi:hypothetical protein